MKKKITRYPILVSVSWINNPLYEIFKCSTKRKKRKKQFPFYGMDNFSQKIHVQIQHRMDIITLIEAGRCPDKPSEIRYTRIDGRTRHHFV